MASILMAKHPGLSLIFLSAGSSRNLTAREKGNKETGTLEFRLTSGNRARNKKESHLRM